MNGSSIYQSLYQGYHNELIAALTNQINDILRGVAPLTALAIMAWVLVFGKNTMYGQLTAGEAMTRIGRAIVISSLMQVALFNQFITDMATHVIPDAITAAVHGNTGLTGAQGFDGIDNAISNLGSRILNQAVGIQYIGYQVGVWIAQFVAMALNAMNFVIWLLAMATIGLVVAIIPFTLPLWLFDFTRDIGARLVGKLIGLFLVLAVTQIIVNVVVRQTGEYIKSPQGHPVAAASAQPNFEMNAGMLAYTGGFDAPAGSAPNTAANAAAGANVPGNATINVVGSIGALWHIALAELVGFFLMLISVGICMSIGGSAGFSAAPALGLMTMAASRGASIAMGAARGSRVAPR